MVRRMPDNMLLVIIIISIIIIAYLGILNYYKEKPSMVSRQKYDEDIAAVKKENDSREVFILDLLEKTVSEKYKYQYGYFNERDQHKKSKKLYRAEIRGYEFDIQEKQNVVDALLAEKEENGNVIANVKERISRAEAEKELAFLLLKKADERNAEVCEKAIRSIKLKYGAFDYWNNKIGQGMIKRCPQVTGLSVVILKIIF